MSDTDRTTEAVFPFSWTEWDQIDTACFQFSGVRWEAAWGPFVEGQEEPCLSIDYASGALEVYDETGSVTQRVRFAATPMPPQEPHA